MKLIHMNLWQPDSNNPNPGLATLAGSFHHIWRSEMAAYIFLGIIVALALYWLFAHENPAKEE